MLVHEILTKAAEITSRKQKIEFLQKNSTRELLDILRGSFDDDVQFNLPGGTPPYTPATPNEEYSTLARKHKDFIYFCKGGPGDKMPKSKREQLFIDLLEKINAEDAKLVISMINKEQPMKTITKALVKEAFPKLIKK